MSEMRIWIPPSFHYLSAYITGIVSLTANTFLIFVIITTEAQKIGKYRYLLLAFAICDIIISIVNPLLVPAIISTSFGYIFFGFRVFEMDRTVASALYILWLGFYYDSFLLLGFHFVYRYVSVCSPSSLQQYRDRPLRFWGPIGLIATVLYTTVTLFVCISFMQDRSSLDLFAPFMQQFYQLDLRSPDEPQYVALLFYDTRSGSCVVRTYAYTAIVIAICSSIVALVFFCSFQIIARMRKYADNVSAASRALQLQLFRALISQFIVPFVFAYTPLFAIHAAPATGINLDGMGTIFFICTAFFPAIDPFLVIIFIRSYRERASAVFRWLMYSSKTNIVQPHTTIASTSAGG